MTITLGIDTATCVAVGIACDQEVLASVVVDGSRAHAEQLMPAVRQASSDAGIELGAVDQVVVGMGPGPFTGLRVGIVTAQVLAVAVNAVCRGVCTLDVLGAQASELFEEFLVATDARRNELYWAHYRAGERIGWPQVGAAAQLPTVSASGMVLPVFGPASRRYPETAKRADLRVQALDPQVLAVRGWALPEVGSEPLYLRRPDATVSTKRKSVLPRRR